MGKKNKKTVVQRPGQTSENICLDRATKKEILDLCTQLLEKCVEPISSGSREWDDFMEIYNLIQKIRDRQKNLVSTYHDRTKEWPHFLQWLKENGVDYSRVDIQEFPGYGFGLKAVTDLKEGDLILSIPRKLIMSVDSARKSQMGPLITEDQILRVMPNVVLAMYLLKESKSSDSFWMPYIKCLPSTYNTTLYFTPEELKLLKGSPVLSETFTHYQSIARQYAYFYKRLQNNHFASKLPLREGFTYDSYRWAVSSVTTRLNQIPTPDGSQMTYALIPLWDMCNHCNGQLSTDFDLLKNSSECYAMADFKKDEQVFIFYGSRPNAHLLLYNGFVYPENLCDTYAIKLGVSKSDPLFTLKTKVLGLAKLPIAPFHLRPGLKPVSSDLLAFLRVSCMDEPKLQELLQAGNLENLSSLLKNEEVAISVENELKVWNFLSARIELLLGIYPTTLQADKVQLENKELNDRSHAALQLIIGEKTILENTLMYAMSKKLSLS